MADFSDLDSMVFDSIQEEATLQGVVDIVFLLDVTGSMGPAVVKLVKNMSNFIQNIDLSLVKDYRVKIASFGDFELDSDDIKFNISRAYTKEPQEIYNDFLDVIELIKKKGGKDIPESSLDALYQTISDGFKADWTERTRVVIVFTDAISKEIQKDTIGMDLPNDEKLQMLSQHIGDNKVRTYIYAPSDDNLVKLSQLQSEYVIYNAIDSNGDNPVDALQKLNFEKEMKTLGKVVSQTSLII
ncbi:MAG: VWA domain-containing protein [Campylobacterota bacterium]|nr:VWA domain-containing protein [Campylobacterota bacterium]